MASKDFKKGKIYCIRNTIDDDIYVGSTTQPLSKRMAWHRQSMNSKSKNHYKLYTKMRELGVTNFYIELIEDCPCDNLEQLRMREGHFMREISTLNHHVPGRSYAQWLLDNKEVLQERQKAYEKANKEHRLNKMRTYQLEHTDEIKEWKTTRHICGCGGTYTNTHKSRHMKTEMHQTWLQQQTTND